jgi:hypothetical protein
MRIFFFFVLSGMRLSPLGNASITGLFFQPQMIDDGDCGAVGVMKIGRGNRSTRRKPDPAPLCPPHIPYEQTWARTRAAGGKPATNCLSHGAATRSLSQIIRGHGRDSKGAPREYETRALPLRFPVRLVFSRFEAELCGSRETEWRRKGGRRREEEKEEDMEEAG